MRKLTAKMLGMFMIAGIVSVFSSCSNDDEPQVTLPQISVERSHYNLATGSIEVGVKADVAPVADIIVPVKVAGTADASGYSLSASQFVIKAGETSSYITISRVGEPGENNETLTVNLEQGVGYTLGLTNYIEVTLLSKHGYIMSFDESESRLNESNVYGVTLYKTDGSQYKPSGSETVQIEVDTENSTAVEGVNFKFTDGNIVTFSNKARASFGIEVIKAEEGKDKLVLRLAEKAGFASGSNPTMTITVAGQDNFAGTWAFPSSIYNIDLFSSYGEDIESAPKCSSADKITLAGGPDSYTFTPAISGDFKNYFGTDSRTVKYDGIVFKNFQELSGRQVPVSQLKFPGMNVKFSATASDVREAIVAFRLITVDNQEVLECTIDDWEPAENAFGGSIFSFGMAEPGEPPMVWAPLRLHLTRVK
ncbi:MAG: hypothetical protein K2L41_07075 [Muribaculaceae bacterium]|nr:hypothetical protein [Muribaculaceae bacterium]